MGTAEGVYKYRAIRRKSVETSYDPLCVDYLETTYNDYIPKDAKSSVIATRFSENKVAEEIPMRGRGFVPRRVYTKPADYLKHGYTQGCKGCT